MNFWSNIHGLAARLRWELWKGQVCTVYAPSRMRILLDECVPVALKWNSLRWGTNVKRSVNAGFAGKKNGELLTLAERRGDVLLTTD